MPLEISEDQVLWFRARRSHLAGDGAPCATSAAAAILGAQAQIQPPALFALSQRMADRPTAEELGDALFGDRKKIIRTWGQRDTVHIYDPADWNDIVAARGEWATQRRRGEMPTTRELNAIRKLIAKSPDGIVRGDMLDKVPQRMVDEFLQMDEVPDKSARRFAAGRIFWKLSLDGSICMGGKKGAEQVYAARELWFPELDWPESHTPRDAALRLLRRYFSLYGPATVQDAAHFFGARISMAREWIADIAGELAEVACNGRTLLARKADLDDLRTHAPAAKDWPVRILPLWDTMLMGHADKSWTTPVEAERKLVWRKAALVAASVLDRGRIVATWSHRKKGRRLECQIEPLSGWRKTKHLPGVKREMKALTKHLGAEEFTLQTT